MYPLMQAEESAKRNEELRQRAEARIAAALKASAETLRQRRMAFGEKQALNEERALCVPLRSPCFISPCTEAETSMHGSFCGNST